VLSAIGSLFGFGLSPYMNQITINEICSVLSLIVGIIGSLEIFLNLNNRKENELVQSKELYLFAIEIQKILLLDIQHRHCDGVVYLEDKFTMYTKFIQDSYLLECRIIDELTPLPKKYQIQILDSEKIIEQAPRRGTFTKLVSPKNIKNNKIEPASIMEIKRSKSIDSPIKKKKVFSIFSLKYHIKISKKTKKQKNIPRT